MLVEHEDTNESAHCIIRMQLINKEKKPLKIQKKLDEIDGRLYDTSAGQPLFTDLGKMQANTKTN